MRKKGDRVYLSKTSEALDKSYSYPYVLKHKSPEKYELIMSLGNGDFIKGFKIMERNFIEYKFYLQKFIYKYDSLPMAKRKNILSVLKKELSCFNKNYFYGLRLKAFTSDLVININYYKSLEAIYFNERIKNIIGELK